MSKLDPSAIVRLAIALAALKHKPREQATRSYLLDLQATFPLFDSQGGSCVDLGPPDDEPELARPGTGVEWRTYALELEKQVTTLKAQRDADQELLTQARLRSDESQSLADAPPPKKRRKKNGSSGRDRQEYGWDWERSRADWTNVLQSQYPPAPSLVEAYFSVKGSLAFASEDHVVYASRLTDAIIRAFETIHVFMLSMSYPTQQPQSDSPISSRQLKPEHIDSARIAMVSPLLMYILRTGLPNLVDTARDTSKRKSLRPSQRLEREMTSVCVDKVLDRLLECVLLPLLRSFKPLCVARLAPLLPPPPSSSSSKKSKRENTEKRVPMTMQTDTRTDMFALLGMSLNALDALPSKPTGNSGLSDTRAIARGVRDRLGLEAIRELEALYVDARCTRPPSQTPTPTGAASQPQAQAQPRDSSSETAITGTVTDTQRRSKTLEQLVGSREERMYALATRDATWFLARTLDLCVSQVGSQGDCSGLLREALIDRIGKLVRWVDVSAKEQSDGHSGDGGTVNREWNRFRVDPVCQNMLLATCERAMSGFG